VRSLAEQGVDAVAPYLSPGWHSKPSDRWWETSLWSERHVAYASGLGTFGLCDGLITPVGKAVRIGSVLARIQISATPRPYIDHHAYCLYFAEGTCGRCMSRCPAGAITEVGHDKAKCKEYMASILEHVRTSYRIDVHPYPCGLCQTGVPCESGVPGDGRRRYSE
jgi:epoxyqueuosine reductase QueG